MRIILIGSYWPQSNANCAIFVNYGKNYFDVSIIHCLLFENTPLIQSNGFISVTANVPQHIQRSHIKCYIPRTGKSKGLGDCN